MAFKWLSSFLQSVLLALFQVSAGPAAGSAGRTEIPDPMQIEVSLGADVDAGGTARASFDQQPLGKARAYPETDFLSVIRLAYGC